MQQPIVVLNNGLSMPLLGLGVYKMHGKVAENAIQTALQTGYRLIDTAAAYGNEQEVGNAVRASGIDRRHIFVTTKVDNKEQGYDSTLRAFDESMKKLNLEYIDLYLVHWPVKDKRHETWRALERLYSEKKVRGIGVANYLLPFLKELERYSSTFPLVNQLEFSPFLYLKDELNYCRLHRIQLQAYSPLTRTKKFNHPGLASLATKYGKSPAQIILRWNIQLGVSVIPKSSSPQRIKENFDIFDFSISTDDMQMMETFDEGFRVVESPMGML